MQAHEHLPDRDQQECIDEEQHDERRCDRGGIAEIESLIGLGEDIARDDLR
jgi:hypothetical protein